MPISGNDGQTLRDAGDADVILYIFRLAVRMQGYRLLRVDLYRFGAIDMDSPENGVPSDIRSGKHQSDGQLA